MTDAIRARLADAVDTLSDLDALMEHRAGRLPPILLAKALLEINGVAARLAALRQTIANGTANPKGCLHSRNAPEAG